MSLMNETLIISGTMIVLCSLPLFSKRMRENSKLFFLLGTGALFGICFFDLLPDVFEMGGSKSLLLMGAVWAIYSLAHLLHLGFHHHPSGGASRQMRQPGVLFFLSSMITHCMASGILLVVSQDLAGGIGTTVFFALLAHKTYEALTVSSVLLERKKPRSQSILLIAAYALALPAGVVLTLVFRASITQGVALFATSLAVGTLLGCLIFDFLIPSLSQVRRRRLDFAWIVIGLITTQLLMRSF